jgi:hypothetical protein
MISTRRLYTTGAAFGIAAVGCLVVAFLRRHSLDDAFASIVAGAYFDRSDGGSDAFVGTGNMLDPFRIGNAYLWLGAGCAFAVSALAVAGVARLSPRH